MTDGLGAVNISRCCEAMIWSETEDPTPPQAQNWANTRTYAQPETHEHKDTGRARNGGTERGERSERESEGTTGWGAQKTNERGKRKNSERGGRTFYPHVHSVRGVTECNCSWTFCQNTVATAASIHLRPISHCTHTGMCKCTWSDRTLTIKT